MLWQPLTSFTSLPSHAVVLPSCLRSCWRNLCAASPSCALHHLRIRSMCASSSSRCAWQMERARLGLKGRTGAARPTREQEVLHFQWFADMGNTDAQRMLARLLQQSRGRADRRQALHYFRHAQQSMLCLADRGSLGLTCTLGTCRCSGWPSMCSCSRMSSLHQFVIWPVHGCQAAASGTGAWQRSMQWLPVHAQLDPFQSFGAPITCQHTMLLPAAPVVLLCVCSTLLKALTWMAPTLTEQALLLLTARPPCGGAGRQQMGVTLMLWRIWATCTPVAPA